MKTKTYGIKLNDGQIIQIRTKTDWQAMAEQVSGPAARNRSSLSAQINAERLAVTSAKRKQAEMLLAKARGELIVRDLVERQASYLLVCLRQRILSLPGAYAGRLVGCPDVSAAGEVLREAALGLLDDLKDFPERVVDPDWLEHVGDEEAPV